MREAIPSAAAPAAILVRKLRRSGEEEVFCIMRAFHKYIGLEREVNGMIMLF